MAGTTTPHDVTYVATNIIDVRQRILVPGFPGPPDYWRYDASPAYGLLRGTGGDEVAPFLFFNP